MPGVPNRSSGCRNGIWSRHRDDITFDQRQKFWSELPPHARRQLLRIDKQTLFEHARKNLYCSRCNGLLLEGFSQIVMYGKSLQQEALNKIGSYESEADDEFADLQDPGIHPWGGLAATRDGILTVLDCFIHSKSLKPLQNVFDSARAREHERELLYPDACGGGGRGWISQGIASYGRGHGTRETCALHTARLSCDTLVDFWSALRLSDETRLSLVRMKEEDFIERLMYRFDNKRFCRDCRRNIIREFKELKELKRMRKEPRCTTWFCVADTAFQYEVTKDAVKADWHQSFADTVGTYHHFEWAIGTGEGKTDIVDFIDVGMNEKVQTDGLDLGGLSACFITLRAWKLDNRFIELTVKAHALKGQPCIHRRLVVGDGYVTITQGESIRRFFEHAEEAEEEEDDDAMDKDGNEFEGEVSRPQKHAKSPELAREFLLDAATVIFKEQVEKAFREGTARQNAHSVFVSLGLKLLEERVHVACKELVTLEKQFKLLEEVEKEKKEEEERKERRRTKEREKKLRRKERIKGKERKQSESKSASDSPVNIYDESPNGLDSGDSVSDPGDNVMPAAPISPHTDKESIKGCIDTASTKCDSPQHHFRFERDINSRDGNGTFIVEQSKSSRRKLRSKKDPAIYQTYRWYDKRRCTALNEGSFQPDEYGMIKSSRESLVKTNSRSCTANFSERMPCSNCRTQFDLQTCSCNHHRKETSHISMMRSARNMNIASKKELIFDVPHQSCRSNGVISNGKLVTAGASLHIKQVWEPTGAWRKCTRGNSDPDFSLPTDPKVKIYNGHCLSEFCELSNNEESNYKYHHDNMINLAKLGTAGKPDCEIKGCTEEEVDSCFNPSTYTVSNSCGPRASSSSSDNCSSCLSEGDMSTNSSSAHNTESPSTSDSEEVYQQSDGRDSSLCKADDVQIHHDPSEIKQNKNEEDKSQTAPRCEEDPILREESERKVQTSEKDGFIFNMPISQNHVLPLRSECMQIPTFPSAPMGYHDKAGSSWPASAGDFLPFPQHSHYVYSSPMSCGPSDFCMAFTPMQPSPVFGVQQHNFYHAPTANTMILASSREQIHNNSEDCDEEVGTLRRGPSVNHNGCVGNFEKSHGSDSSPFSLFHFGDPLAGAAGFCVSPVCLKENNCGLPSASPSAQGDNSCLKEKEITEYSLFYGSNFAIIPPLHL